MDTRDNKKRSKDIDHKASSSTHKKTRRSHDPRPRLKFKDMRKISSNDEAFHLPVDTMSAIILFIHSRKTSSRRTCGNWNEYAVSFYLKMCTFSGLDYRHLEDGPSSDQLIISASLKEEQEVHTEFSGVNKPSTVEVERAEQEVQTGCRGLNLPSKAEIEKQMWENKITSVRRVISGPFEFGVYSSGTEPECIPYPLYLLVKRAAELNNTGDLTELKCVEGKIRFFCHFFYPHLPCGWTYDRDKACSLIAGYDATRKPSMAGYKPFCRSIVRRWSTSEYHRFDRLARQDMVYVMSIVHSRKTPSFWTLCVCSLIFYYRLCSCFGIDFSRLEAASEDDVCLMIT